MLVNLFIKDFILIEQVAIEFAPGLCVITGETGAGKSILLDALLFSLGLKSSVKYIRNGKAHTTVIATFDISMHQKIKDILAEHNMEAEDELILRRTLNADGRGKIFVNDFLVKSSFAKHLAEALIEIHGQNEQSSLLEPINHCLILDSFGNLGDDAQNVKNLFHKLENKKSHLTELLDTQQEVMQEEEFLLHAIKEIKDLSIKPDEENILSEQRISLVNKEKIIETLNSALTELTLRNDILKTLSHTIKLLNRNALIEEEYTSIISSLEQAYLEASEAINQLESKLEQVNNNESKLEAVEQRLSDLRSIARKYNRPVNNLLEFLTTIEEKHSHLTSQQSKIDLVQSEIAHLKELYFTAASKLSSARKEYAKQLENSVMKELAELHMEYTVFSVNVTPLLESEWNINGFDNVYFMATTNPGIPPLPIHKIASGGELSRFMLAMKIALLKVKSTGTIIFDEIDTGVGGAIADSIGSKLSLLSNSAQVIVITHQPQIAVKGNNHLHVTKHQTNLSTTTNILSIVGEKRKEEIARMLSGKIITSEAKAAASKLLDA